MIESIVRKVVANEVLLVEDSPGDVRLTREALNVTRFPINLHVALDGMEAMAFLSREGQYRDAPRPDMILLDLMLPKKHGRDVLKEIKETSTLKSIPVIIFATSAYEIDILEVYLFHANCYITKPSDFAGYINVATTIDNFWLSVATLPREARL